MATPLLQHFLLALFFFSNFYQNSNATKNHNGFSLKIIHRDSPGSPIYRTNLTESKKWEEYIRLSNSRVKSLTRLHGTNNTSTSRSSHTNDQIIRPSMGLMDLFYYVQVGIGTFNQGPRFKTYYLGLDTGSDLTWLQCQGCGQNCFPQEDPLYPAPQSKSYIPFPCEHCPSSAQCQSDGCRLERTYSDDSSVIAIAAHETFTFQSEYDRYLAMFNTIFGCGVNMKNFEQGRTQGNKISGLMGMGYGDFSFWSQFESVSHNRFSYCLQLPSAKAAGGSPMFLRFGNDVVQPSGLKSTPLQKFQDRQTYYLNLQGISVSNHRLDVDPSVFQLTADGSRGCIVDSGAATSYIVTDAYGQFSDAVSNVIETSNHNVRRMDKPELGLNLCYERVSDPINIEVPIITYHFANDADFVINPPSSFVVSKSHSGNDMICLMYLESTQEDHNGVTYLGAYQQMNQRMIYENGVGQLLFGQDNCAMAN